MLIAIYCVFILFLSNCGECSEFKQEMAKIVYRNPKYHKDFSILTYRESRRSPYLTSINVTSLVPFGNNVTFRFQLSPPKLSDFPFIYDFKTCDGLKIDWLKHWLRTYSNINVDECPVPPNFYHMWKFEFPPKNFPFQFNYVDYDARLIVFVTSSKEKIAEITLSLKYTNKKGK